MAKGCNRKIKLLVSELFGVGWMFIKVTFASGTASQMQHGGKTNLPIEKRKMSHFLAG